MSQACAGIIKIAGVPFLTRLPGLWQQSSAGAGARGSAEWQEEGGLRGGSGAPAARSWGRGQLRG